MMTTTHTPSPPSFARDLFVGRTMERARILETLAQPGGLVWVHGLPGSGKTRLVRRAARDLVEAGQADGIVHWTAGDEIPPGPRQLMVLDPGGWDAPNGELRALLADRPELRVLVAARVRPDQPVAAAIRVGPMTRADAVSLFQARRRAAGAHDPDDFDAIASLMDRLDRLPAAIEFAAGQRLLSVMELGAATLTTPGLEDALTPAWNALDADLRGMLCALATFGRAFGLSDARQVMDSDEPIQALEALDDLGLIHVEPGPGGTQLHILECVRGFVARRTCPAPQLRARIAEATPSSVPGLEVGRQTLWFSVAGAPPISMEHRPTLRRVLAHLAATRARTPGRPTSLEELFEVAWPDQHIHHESARRRVYVAIHTLRELGLREVLVTREGGYLLDEAWSFTRATG